MAEDLLRIRRFVNRLMWRERAVIGLEIAGRTLLLSVFLLLLAVLAPALEWDRGGTAAWLALIAGTGVWVAIVVPLVLRWARSGDALRQARLAEAQEPNLRGRLVTTVERGDGAGDGESEALVALVARRASVLLADLRPSKIHSGLRQAALFLVALGALILPLPLSFFAGGPVQVVKWWAAGFEASAALAILGTVDGEDRVQVGDLVLRYTYPSYTGLEPRVVENSTGDVQGPSGTQVRVTARSADPVEAAGLVAYEERFEAQVKDERLVEGAFTIGRESGTYHVVTWRGDASQRSKDFQITLEEDLAPEVMVDGAEPWLDLAVDEAFQLIWRARDDYGVAKVAIRVDGEVNGNAISKPTERRAEVFGDLWRTPGDLGLKPGMEVELDLAAWDNDTFNGSKMGVSPSIQLVVLGPRGLARRNETQMKNLLEAMLTGLADHLEEPWPVGLTAKDYASWGERVAERYQPLQDMVDSEWDKMAEGSLEKTALEEAVKTGGELVRYTAVAFDPRSKELANGDAVDDTADLRDKAIEALEDGVLALDRTLRLAALGEVVRMAEAMEERAGELAELMKSDNPDPLEMMAKLEALEAQLMELMKAAAKLDEGGLKEYLNARNNEVTDLMSEVRKALAEGRMEDAKKLMERLAKQIEQMSQGVSDTMERQQQDGSDAMDQAEGLKEELERLEKEQRELQEQVSEIRDQQGMDDKAEVERVWKDILAASEQLVGETGDYASELVSSKRGFSEVQRAEHGNQAALRLRDAAERQDLRGAKASHRVAQMAVDAMYRGMQSAEFASPNLKGPGRKQLGKQNLLLDRIETLLDQLTESEASPQTQQATQELQQRQQELEEQLKSAQQKAEQLAQEFPVRPKGMGESLDEAGERMDEASEDLGKGKPMPAEGSQGAAADRIREAKESLEKAMQQAAQQQQAMQQGQESGKEPGDKDSSSKDSNQRPQVEIPGAEDFRTPEEYRRALLQGMEGDVPEEYRAMKKRYFEELVQQ